MNTIQIVIQWKYLNNINQLLLNAPMNDVIYKLNYYLHIPLKKKKQ